MLSSRMRVKPFAMVDKMPYGIAISYSDAADGSMTGQGALPLSYRHILSFPLKNRLYLSTHPIIDSLTPSYQIFYQHTLSLNPPSQYAL